jgi:hypothetical protein
MIWSAEHHRAAADGVGCAPEWAGAVGPPRPVPSAERSDSGEWVSEPGRPGAHPTTDPQTHRHAGAVIRIREHTLG